jgi:hypothetical protein
VLVISFANRDLAPAEAPVECKSCGISLSYFEKNRSLRVHTQRFEKSGRDAAPAISRIDGEVE